MTPRFILCWALVAGTPMIARTGDTVWVGTEERESWRPFNRLLLGSNISWTDGADGMFDPVTGQWRHAARALLDSLPLGLLRFPGGHLAESYSWRTGVGPMGSRGSGVHLNGTLQRMVFGTDEFLDYCNRRKVVPLLTVALTGDAGREAIGWIEYCNGRSSTAEGSHRASNGRMEPYNVRLWELGNEVYLTDTSTTAARTYVERANRFAEVSLMVDPCIRLAAVLSGEISGWDTTVVFGLGRSVDMVSLHLYYVSEDLQLANVRKAIVQFGRTVEEISNLLTRAAHRIDIAVTEFGAMPTDGVSFRNQPPDFFTALMHAGALGIFARDSVALAAKWTAASPGRLYFADILRAHTGRPELAPSYLLQRHLFKVILDWQVRAWTALNSEVIYLLTANRTGREWNLLAVNLTGHDREIVVRASSGSLEIRAGMALTEDGLQPFTVRNSPEAVTLRPFSATSITATLTP